MQQHRNAGILLVVLCVLVATTYRTHAEDDIQLIRLNSYSFFVPKSWMGAVSAERATNSGSSNGSWSKPQTEPIDATDITLVYPERSSAIRRYWNDPLPSLIHISTYRDTPVDLSILRSETKKWLEVAGSQPADADGFVRVWAGFAKPGQQPQSEKLVYKGYLNKVGQPLVIFSNNVATPFADHYPSDVFIPVERDLMLRYSFSNKKFPENSWWALYQQTLAFLDYLRKPK